MYILSHSLSVIECFYCSGVEAVCRPLVLTFLSYFIRTSNVLISSTVGIMKMQHCFI